MQFWRHGYCATSIDDLVEATGVSRHGLYAEFGDKHGLYLACFDRYQKTVVSPAFARVESPGAGLSEIRDYFEYQLAAAEKLFFPFIGCFVVNSATEVAPGDPEVRECVTMHNKRLRDGFANALRNEARGKIAGNEHKIAELADMLVVFATGLWTYTRVADSSAPLRAITTEFLNIVKRSIP